MELFQQYHIVIIGCLFLCMIAGMTWLTHKEKKWVKNHYKKEDIIALGFGVICYGLSSDQSPLKSYKGFLLIHRHGLFFKSRFSNTRFDVPGKSIQKVYHANTHKGTKLFRSAVKVDFSISPKIMDTIAFKLSYPPQWIKIIGKAFIKDSL
ncbi:hypothetical protein [Desulfobacula sp.]